MPAIGPLGASCRPGGLDVAASRTGFPMLADCRQGASATAVDSPQMPGNPLELPR